MKKPKYETCVYAESVGVYAVDVSPNCPNYTKIKGRLVSSKDRCNKCRDWKARDRQ